MTKSKEIASDHTLLVEHSSEMEQVHILQIPGLKFYKVGENWKQCNILDVETNYLKSS